MLRVLGRIASSNVQKVTWLLEELGQPYQREDYGGPFGRNREPEYLKLNPNGLIPTLVDGEVVVWESNTILRYLANKFAAHGFYPAEAAARAMVERWMDWQLSELRGTIVAVAMALMAKERRQPEIDAGREKMERCLQILDDALAGRDFVHGNALTLADIALAPGVHRWYALDVQRTERPNVRRWHERMVARPAFRSQVMSA